LFTVMDGGSDTETRGTEVALRRAATTVELEDGAFFIEDLL